MHAIRCRASRPAAIVPERPTAVHVVKSMPVSCRASSGASAWIEEHLHNGAVVKERLLGGSNWASSYLYETENGTKYFVKTSSRQDEMMFKGEASGLQAMYETHTIRVPKVHYYGKLAGPGRAGMCIIMEYLDMGSSADQALLGRKLAEMHLARPSDPEARSGKFGFPVDNTIGGTPQPNAWMDNWVDFYRERRLRHQLKLAGDSTLSRLGDKLLPNLEKFFEGFEVKPSVLHGDLWSGNIAAVDREPVIFDPATYYGHHEAEFGMSWCAGFNQSFWQAYHALIPRAPGFEDRKQLYLLYHYLNHYNMFGGGYYGQCESIMRALTRKC